MDIPARIEQQCVTSKIPEIHGYQMMTLILHSVIVLLMVIQGILDNPSPLRRREKVTDLKSDGLPNK